MHKVRFLLNIGSHHHHHQFHPQQSVLTRSGFPPLRVFQSKHLQAQLELNAVHFLSRQMSVDAWRRRVLLPEILRWHLADLGGETHMLEMIWEIFKRAPEQAPKKRPFYTSREVYATNG